MHAISTEIFPWNLEKYDNNQNVLPVAFYSWNHWYFADGPKACLVLQLTDWSLSQAAADASAIALSKEGFALGKARVCRSE